MILIFKLDIIKDWNVDENESVKLNKKDECVKAWMKSGEGGKKRENKYEKGGNIDKIISA